MQQTLSSMMKAVAKKLKAAKLFYGHGTDNPEDEAFSLVFQALSLPFSLIDSASSYELKETEIEKVKALLKERIEKRIPLAYLTHEAYFFGLPFYVDERVIIPRSSIGELIEHQFEPWVNPEKVTRILDVCTGSACLAIACALAFEYAAVDAVDLSQDALEVAKINVEKHGVKKQVNLIHSDLFNELPAARYDIIISNPPYVSGEEMKTLPAEYHHEPKMAFYSDDHGLALTLRILKEAPKFLNDQGILVVEVGNSDEVLQARFPDIPFTWLEFEQGEGGVFLLTKEELSLYNF